MSIDYESIQTFEVCGPEDSYNETEVTFGLRCIAPYSPGYFRPSWGGEPPFGPEFEVVSISVVVPKVNHKDEVTGYEKPLNLTYEQFEALVGREVTHKLTDLAMEDAAINGNF